MRAMLVVAAVPLLFLLATPAWAHGGNRVYIGDVGPYQVEVYTLVSSDDTSSANKRKAVDYTLYLRNRENSRPVNGADVVVTATRTDGRAIEPQKAIGFTNLYNVQFELDGGGVWEVSAAIDGPLGKATLKHSLDVRSPSFFARYWGYLAVLALLLVVGGLSYAWPRKSSHN